MKRKIKWSILKFAPNLWEIFLAHFCMVSNIIFLDSPAGIGYSYSNTTSDYLNSGDKRTSQDAYIFLINWFERFPQHKTRSFYITGESYSGHYVPQLAYTIILNNKNSNHTVINLKGVAVGNAEIDENNGYLGMYDYFWTHALNSDETNRNIHKFCKQNVTSDACENAQSKGYDTEMGNIDIYNIYADICPCCVEIDNTTKESVHRFNPCTDVFVTDYMNLPEVQKSFHANISDYWSLCSPAKLTWKDSPTTMLPVIQQLIMRNISVWLYSGDIDGRVPVTYTRYTINLLKLPIKSTWRPWHTKKQVAGYVVEYEGVTFVTVRGAGHAVPSYQPEQSLTMISSFLKSELPPSY